MSRLKITLFVFSLFSILFVQGCIEDPSNESSGNEIQSWTHHTDKYGKDSTFAFKDTLYNTVLPKINLTHSDIKNAITAYNADTVLKGHNIHVAASKAIRINEEQNNSVVIYLLSIREEDKQIPITIFYSMKYGVIIRAYHPNIYSCRSDLSLTDNYCETIINQSCFKDIH